MRCLLSIGLIVFILSSFSFAQQPQLHLIGEPELSPTEIVAVRDDETGKFCAAIEVITDLQGFGYSAPDNGVIRVDFSKPGRDLVFLLPNERVLEIYHPDFQPLKIIFSELSIQLQPKQVWIIKLTGAKNIVGGIPLLIETNTDSVAITIDGKQQGIKQAFTVTKGKHVIKLDKPDYETIIDTIVVDENHKQFKYTMLVDLVMVFVKGGTFKMGDTFGDGNDDEKPVHEVTVNDFYIGKYEVTNGQFCKFLNEKGNMIADSASKGVINLYINQIVKKGDNYVPKMGYENHPLDFLSWYGAVEFCNWLSQKHGFDLYYQVDKNLPDINNTNSLDDLKWKVSRVHSSNGYRLPTEAEWEYAARGGNKSKSFKFSGSNHLDEVAWFENNSGNTTHLVGTKRPNELGIYDMSGNKQEWCWDWYDSNYYSKSKIHNPEGPAIGGFRAVRGGGQGSRAQSCRVSNRSYQPADAPLIGLRIVRNSLQKK